MFLLSTAGMILCLSVTAGTAAGYVETGSARASAASIAFIYIFGVTFAVAYTSMQPIYPGEVLTNDMRAKGMGVFQLTSGASGFVNTFAAPVALSNVRVASRATSLPLPLFPLSSLPQLPTPKFPARHHPSSTNASPSHRSATGSTSSSSSSTPSSSPSSTSSSSRPRAAPSRSWTRSSPLRTPARPALRSSRCGGGGIRKWGHGWMGRERERGKGRRGGSQWFRERGGRLPRRRVPRERGIRVGVGGLVFALSDSGRGAGGLCTRTRFR